MILLLGGTSESLAVADWLTAHQRPFILSVTTDYGATLARQHAQQVSEAVLTPATFSHFFDTHAITMVLDATHPFARIISTTIIEAAATAGIPYLRFEREDGLKSSANLVLVDSLTQACDYLKQRVGTVYLSTGSKTAADYADQLGVDRLHVRVLPTTGVMTLLTAAGFNSGQIDGIRGPFTVQLNVELFERANAIAVVTKESGRRGGVQEKMMACDQLGIPCIVIRRPAVDYPQRVSTLADLARYFTATN